MPDQSSRREFLVATAGIALLPGAMPGQQPAIPAPATTTRELVAVQPDIEPLCRLIEEQPRDKVIAAVAKEVAHGVAPRDFLAAAFMTAIRTWPVDHSVYMMHSVGQLSLDLPAEDRLLPIFWSLDSMKHFKWQYQLKPVAADRYPTAEKAASVFEDAMKTGDKETAQAAILSLARIEGPKTAFDRYWRWGAGKSHGTNIGHAAIAVANAYRTLEVIGWRHAGPVLQFLTKTGSEKTPAASMSWPLAKIEDLRPDWAGGESDKKTVLQLVELYRECNPEEAAKATHARIAKGELRAAPIWDAILLLASEHVIRHKVGGVTARPLHSVTLADSLYTAFHACRKPADRLYLLVEAVHWVSKFYDTERQRKQLRDVDILKITPAELPKDTSEAVAEVFKSFPPFNFLEDVLDRKAQDRATAVAFALAQQNKSAEFVRVARQYICRHSTVDAHEIKFPVAALDNYHAVSAEWRPHVFASLVHVLHGPSQEENPAVRHARELLAKR